MAAAAPAVGGAAAMPESGGSSPPEPSSMETIAEQRQLWRASVLNACLDLLNQDLSLVRAEFATHRRSGAADTVIAHDDQDRTLELDLYDFVFFKAISADPKFVFHHTRLAFNMMDVNGTERAQEQEFLMYAPLLNIADAFTVHRIYKHLELLSGGISWTSFSKFIAYLRRGYRANKTWDELKAKLGFAADEVMLKRSPQAADHTEFALGHPGIIFLSNRHVYYESIVLGRGKAIPLESIVEVKKTTIGLQDNGLELASETALFSFVKGRDTWYAYIKELVEATQLAHQCQHLGDPPYLVQLATHAIIRARALSKTVNRDCFDIFAATEHMYPTSFIQARQRVFGDDQLLASSAASDPDPSMSETAMPDTHNIEMEYAQLSRDVNQFLAMIEPLTNIYPICHAVVTWHNPVTSLICFFFLCMSVYYDAWRFVSPSLFLSMFLALAWNGLRRAPTLPQFDKVPRQALSMSTVRTFQRVVQNLNTNLRKLHRLSRWENAERSKQFMGVIAICFVFSVVFNTRHLILLLGVHVFILSVVFRQIPALDLWGNFWSSISLDDDAPGSASSAPHSDMQSGAGASSNQLDTAESSARTSPASVSAAGDHATPPGKAKAE